MTRHFQHLLFIVVVIFLYLPGCNGSPGPYNQPLANVSSPPASVLDEHDVEFYFEHVRDIMLSDSVIVGGMKSIDIDSRGRILVTNIGKKVWLFDREGDYLNTLSAEECHPGFNWFPSQAKFTRTGDILLVNGGGPWGYRFDSDGECIGGMDETFILPTFFDIGSDGSIYGFYPKPSGYHIKKMNRLGRELTRFGIGKTQSHIIRRFIAGGLVVDSNNRVYLALLTSPYVYRFMGAGEPLEKIGWQPPDYRRVTEDIPGNLAAGGIHEAIEEATATRSITTDVFLLDEDKLMVGYWNRYNHEENPNKEYSAYIMSASGDVLTGAIYMEDPFIFAKNGLAYQEIMPKKVGGEVSNPGLRVYRFKEPVP